MHDECSAFSLHLSAKNQKLTADRANSKGSIPLRFALVALVGAGVGERLACNGDEFPVIGARAEVELEDSWRAELDHLQTRGLAVVDLTTPRIAPGAHYKLADAVLRAARAPGSYGGVALVAVGVAGEYDVGVMIVEDLPDPLSRE